MVAVGLFVAVILEQIAVYVFGIWLGGWTNAFYLLSVFGVYQMLIYAISSHKKGRNPQKYYNNLISYGMIKFQGVSVVKNMLVITLLIFAALYAVSYIPANIGNQTEFEDDFSYRYLNDAKEPTKDEIRQLAKKHDISIENYREASFIRIIGSGVKRDMSDDNKLLEDYYDEYSEYDCTSASEYEKLTGIKLEIPTGSYYPMEGRGAYENIWYKFGDMDKLQVQAEGQSISMKYLGNTIYNALIIAGSSGMDIGSRFVLNDEDFDRLKQGLPQEKIETQVLFDINDINRHLKKAASFAREFYKLYVEGMSDDMNVMAYYNSMEELRRGNDYKEMMGQAIVDADTPLKETDWQYDPIMTPLLKQQIVMLIANRILLFGYIFLICFAAVGIIGYTRSESIGFAKAQTFEDIKKLGADKAYRKELLKNQIKKIFVLPTVIGILLLLLYERMILYINDRNFSEEDIKLMFILAGFGLVAVLYQYIIYKVSVKKVGNLLQVN